MKNIKIVLIGKNGVGKTSILSRYTKDIYDEGVQYTIGVEFFTKIIDDYKLQIWDLSGMERFKSIVRSYYNYCNIAILVFDITDVKSLNRLTEWIYDIREQNNEPVSFILVGNKSDKVDQKMDQKIIDAFMTKYKLNQYFETSAKYGTGINEIFETIVKYFADNQIKMPLPKIQEVEIEETNNYNLCCWNFLNVWITSKLI